MKKSNTDTIFKNSSFPFGIFIMLLLIESFVACVGTLGYFMYTARKSIKEIEKSTYDYSETIAEAFSYIAERCYQNKDYTKLKYLFRQKINEQAIFEAFFVLKDGTLIAHSALEVEKELKGNIANDEFSYNLDLIMKPIRENNLRMEFTEYNIISKVVPFPRRERLFLKKYLYGQIDRTGWLAGKAVFVDKKPVGTVNFIISKARIYNFIKSHIMQSFIFLGISLAGVVCISWFISTMIMYRYRGVSRNIQLPKKFPKVDYRQKRTADTGRYTRDDFITIELLSEAEDDRPSGKSGNVPIHAYFDDADKGKKELEFTESDRIIRDPIPLMRKR